jgi:signal transduction histidine kinase
MRGESALEQLLAAARFAAQAERERTLGVVLERLLVGSGASAGLLVAFDRSGREAARAARGGPDSVRAAALVPRAAAGICAEADALAAPLALAVRPIGVAYVEGLGAAAARRFDAHAARAAVAVANATLVCEAQARSELLARLGHEVRNPLAGIIGFSDLLPEEKSELPPRYIHLMAHIQDDAQRIKRYIETLLELLRAEATPPATGVPVEAACTAVARRFATWAEAKGVGLEVSSAPATALVEPELMVLALANLTANALAATPSGGRVAVHGAATRAQGAEPRWGAPAALAVITVEDSGPSLPPSVLEARAGGLYVTREIARRYGGSLESEPGPGARLVLSLPAIPT